MEVTKKTVYIGDGFEMSFEPVDDSITVKKTDESFELRYLTQDELDEGPGKWRDDELFLVNYHSGFYVTKDIIITKDDVREWYQGEKIEQSKDYHIFQLACLIHSGVWLSLGSSFAGDPGGWDTSHIGVVLVSKKETSDENKALKLAQGLVEEWNQYLSNDVYCLVRETYDGNKNHLDFDSIGGYYGYKEALKALKTEI